MALRFKSVYMAGCFHGTADTAGRLGPNYVASQSYMALLTLSKVLSKVEQLNLYRIVVLSRIRRRRPATAVDGPTAGVPTMYNGLSHISSGSPVDRLCGRQTRIASIEHVVQLTCSTFPA